MYWKGKWFSLHFDEHLLLLDYFIVFKSLFSFLEICEFCALYVEMYEHSWIYGHVEFAVWGYWDKKEFVAFQPVDEGLLINLKTLNLLILAKKKKGKRKFNRSFPIIIISRKCMSCQQRSFPRWVSLLTLKHENFCATQVSYPSFWCLGQIHHKWS